MSPPAEMATVLETPCGNNNNNVREVIVVVDPYSTGCLIAQEMTKRGYGIIALWTTGFAEEMKTHVPLSCSGLEYLAQVDQGESMEETKKIVENAAGAGATVAGCIAGGEAGVDFADAFSEYLGVRTNGTRIPNKRDKKIQQELISRAGLRSTRQAAGDKFEHVEHFLKTEKYPVVLKPIESAGSDGVKLCHSFEEAKEHFHVLMNSQMVNGGMCPSVLCQEFLDGKEYVVDQVSRDGVHKTTMVWVYDKRPANGGAFCYFGCVPVDPFSEEGKVLIPYTRRVLDALDVKNGPSHAEIMITRDGPCLVEMNCRAHGLDGIWRPLCLGLTGGYSQVEAAVDAFLDADAFKALPEFPPSPFKAAGQEIILVSYSTGTVKSTIGYEMIKQLPSFVCLETMVTPGCHVDYTVDLITAAGSVILMHPDEEVLKKDIQFIRYMEEFNGLFVYETKQENLKRPRGDNVVLDTISSDTDRRVFSSDTPKLVRHFSNDRPELRGPLVKTMTTVDASKEAVVVVDPYSTGCCIAEEITKRGFNVIALWTNAVSPEMMAHVPISCDHLKYFAEMEEGSSLSDTVSNIYNTAKQFRVVACIAGSEAGVRLADAISERINVRSNGTKGPDKRDKKLQQEMIRKAGFRSVRQAAGDKFSDVEMFLKNEHYPVVVKPAIKSVSSSDVVKLCHNFEEAKAHFDDLVRSQTKAPVVVCQEFLRGKEYVVDQVSRDGVHKVTMVWTYEKRPANGSSYVYFGCIPVDSETTEAKLIISYARGILDAMDIKNGPTHAEIMMTPTGPCLVEMNCRAHGGDGNWRPVCRALTGGYSQVDATADAYLDKKQFSIIPNKPPSPFKAWGQEVLLVSYSRGTVKSTPGFDVIKQLASFVYLETGVKKGSVVDYTVDLFSAVGSVMLMHRDKETFEKDVKTIRQLEKDNRLFEYEKAGQMFGSRSVPRHLPGVSAANRPDVY